MVLAATGQFPRQLLAQTDMLAVAAGSSLTEVGWIAPNAATINAVTYTPAATMTGVATNNRTFNLVNTGQTGVGTTVVATLTFNSGINAAADAQRALTLSAVAGALDVAAGDVLIWQSVFNGTGIADPGGIVNITAVTP